MLAVTETRRAWFSRVIMIGPSPVVDVGHLVEVDRLVRRRPDGDAADLVDGVAVFFLEPEPDVDLVAALAVARGHLAQGGRLDGVGDLVDGKAQPGGPFPVDVDLVFGLAGGQGVGDVADAPDARIELDDLVGLALERRAGPCRRA